MSEAKTIGPSKEAPVSNANGRFDRVLVAVRALVAVVRTDVIGCRVSGGAGTTIRRAGRATPSRSTRIVGVADLLIDRCTCDGGSCRLDAVVVAAGHFADPAHFSTRCHSPHVVTWHRWLNVSRTKASARAHAACRDRRPVLVRMTTSG